MTRRHPTDYVLLALLAGTLVLLLAGCGGGSTDTNPAPTVLATDTSTSQAGDDRTGAAVLVLALPGPTVTLTQPAAVRVQLLGSVQQRGHYSAQATLDVRVHLPYTTGSTQTAAPLPWGTATLPIDYAVVIDLPAGRTTLQALATVRATDGNGLSTAALATANATADWLVILEPKP